LAHGSQKLHSIHIITKNLLPPIAAAHYYSKPKVYTDSSDPL
jgi:hypothetical protein